MPLRAPCVGGRDHGIERALLSRRAVEERMKAQRAITEAARSWHAKLAEDFAARAVAYASNPDTAVNA